MLKHCGWVVLMFFAGCAGRVEPSPVPDAGVQADAGSDVAAEAEPACESLPLGECHPSAACSFVAEGLTDRCLVECCAKLDAGTR